jgi:hypothetical protein
VWLAKWTSRLFPVDHWHLVFTVPHHLNFFFQHYPAQMGEIFFAAVSQTLTKLFADPQWLGGRVGALAMLQSWDNENKHHPHMHILLTSGGADKSGAWIGLKRGPKFLMPHLVISRMFRAIFMDLFRKAEYSGAIKAPAGTSFAKRMKFFESVKEKAFVVEISEPYSHGEGVLKYLAGHVHGGPIPNSRVVSVSSTLVTFRMKPRPHLADLKLTLDLETFLSRLLSHMPPPGFHIVRAYGLYSPSSKLKVTGLPANDSNKDAIPDDPHLLCPRCRRPMIVRDRGDILPNFARPTRRSVFVPARASPKAAVA